MVSIEMRLRFTCFPLRYRQLLVLGQFLEWPMALRNEAVTAEHPFALAIVVMDDERRFVVAVDFFAPVIVDLERRSKPIERHLAANGNVVDAHGSSISSRNLN